MASAPSLSRRRFLQRSAAASSFTIVPPHVLGGPGKTPPSETFGGALIGVGGRGPATFRSLSKRHGLAVKKLAECDVKWLNKADQKTIYTDFRRVLERDDIDIVAIATPPHWHALISIAAMEAGKDVLCEKPMTRFIDEGRAVAEAAKRYKRIFQIGTYGRFGVSQSNGNVLTHKIIKSGLLQNTEARHVRRGGFKVKQWSGRVDIPPKEPPKNLDWDMYCGPSPLRPYHPPRHGATHRWYWDYEGGGLGDMGQHHLDPLNWLYAKDATSPVEVEASAPPAHPDVAGMWAWSRLKYADGFELVLESGEWGEPTGLGSRPPKLADLAEEDQKKIKSMPDPEPLVEFGEAVKTRKQPGGHAEAAHRTACLMHLTNIAIRTGRKIHYDPVAERVVGDEEADRLANQPMRAPWHL